MIEELLTYLFVITFSLFLFAGFLFLTLVVIKTIKELMEEFK